MKLHFLSISLFSLANAFSTTNRCLWSPSSLGKAVVDSNTVLFAEGSKRMPMSPDEILAQQREKQGLPEIDEHPKLYSDELLEDMKQILRLLERRVRDGQGSISRLEVEEFVAMSNNVVVEMKQKEFERLVEASSPAASTTASEGSTNAPTATVGKTPPIAADAEDYHPTQEGPDYDPSGGQGSIPRETTNTYIIPGMDEMSPEEYRLELQKSISARQSKRKSTGITGNRNTWDYLNNLGAGHTVMRKDILED